MGMMGSPIISLDVRLPERFSIIEKLKKSYAVKRLCEVFGVYRSSYRYWANRDKSLSSERVLARRSSPSS